MKLTVSCFGPSTFSISDCQILEFPIFDFQFLPAEGRANFQIEITDRKSAHCLYYHLVRK